MTEGSYQHSKETAGMEEALRLELQVLTEQAQEARKQAEKDGPVDREGANYLKGWADAMEWVRDQRLKRLL